jgi:phosphatidylglycerophosphate synthase
MSTESFGHLVGALSGAQKPSAGTPAYSRFVNRRIGRYLAAAAYKLHRTPNQVSVISGLFSLAGVTLVATLRPSALLAVAVTALLVTGYALDSADGQLARLRGGGSLLGEWLDHMIDSAKIFAVHAAVLVSFYRFDAFGNDVALLVPLCFLGVASVTFFGQILVDQLRRRRGLSAPNPRGESTVKALLILPIDYGVLCLVFLTFGQPSVFLLVYGALLLANAALLVAAVVKWYGELAAVR